MCLEDPICMNYNLKRKNKPEFPALLMRVYAITLPLCYFLTR